ncbi:MAG: site-specific integrase [bacterium]
MSYPLIASQQDASFSTSRNLRNTFAYEERFLRVIRYCETESDLNGKEVRNHMEKAKRSARQRGVYKRGTSWYIRYKHKGKLYRESVGPSHEKAVQALYARKLQIAEGTFEQTYGVKSRKSKPVTFNQFADRFLSEYSSAPGKKPSLREFYECELVALRRHMGDMPLSHIARGDVIRFKMRRASEFRKDGQKKVAPSTVNRALAALSKIFNYAIQCGLIKENPCKGVERFKEKRGRVVYLEPHECTALIEAMAPHARPVIIALLNTGARRNEILSLDWKQVDMKRRQIVLDESKTADEEPEYLPINDTLYRTFQEIGPKKSGPVFVNREGRQFRDIRTPFFTALKKTGIAEARRRAGKPPLRIHDLRHTTASLLSMEGQPLQDIQKLLRHRNITTTMRYAHLSPDHMQKVARTLDSILSSDTKSDTGSAVLAFPVPKKRLY